MVHPLVRQESIYQEFRDTDLSKGLVSTVPENKGGYIVALRHPEEIEQEVGAVSNIAMELAHGVVGYGPNCNNVHTSLVTALVQDGFKANGESLEKLADATGSVLANIKAITPIFYGTPITNEDTIIVPGYTGNTSFFDAADMLKSMANADFGGDVRAPPMQHMTAARYLGAENADTAREIRDRISERVVGLSKPVKADVGYFVLNPQDGFDLYVHTSFDL